jgi:hypothetical protein
MQKNDWIRFRRRGQNCPKIIAWSDPTEIAA